MGPTKLTVSNSDHPPVSSLDDPNNALTVINIVITTMLVVAIILKYLEVWVGQCSSLRCAHLTNPPEVRVLVKMFPKHPFVHTSWLLTALYYIRQCESVQAHATLLTGLENKLVSVTDLF